MITGVSGSGKSTLAFDILFDAGRRGYLQSIGVMPDPGTEQGYEQISGLLATAAHKQGIIRQSNPRSVVGTRVKLLHCFANLFASEHNRRHAPEQAITSAHFSFNSPMGMCLDCQGRGQVFELQTSVLTPDPTTTLYDLYKNAHLETTFDKRLQRLQSHFSLTAETPFHELATGIQNLVLYGQPFDGKKLTGIQDFLTYRFVRGREFSGAIACKTCPSCGGTRLAAEARTMTLKGKHLGQLGQLSIKQLKHYIDHTLDTALRRTPQVKLIKRIIKQMLDVQLGYLTMYRPLPTLSGGELQRLFLMSHLDAELESLLYIFDEPTTGLHEAEKQQFLSKLLSLKNHNNAIIVVEHDPVCIAAAEHIIDMGPLAGTLGGQIVYQGSYKGLLKSKESVTGQYLSASGTPPLPLSAITAGSGIQPNHPSWLSIDGVCTNNLKNLSVKLPLMAMTGVAGVSGSGKSSLIARTLVPALQHHLSRHETSDNDDDEEPETSDAELANNSSDQHYIAGPLPVYSSFNDNQCLHRCVEITQQPIGRRSNSNPVSYLGIWSRIRALFAKQNLARERRYTAGNFSFNAGGACPQCHGSGETRLWLGTSHMAYPCQACDGKRYLPEILEVTFHGLDIDQVLQLSVKEACSVFEQDKPITRMLDVLQRTGLEYLTLGQPTATLSGGEAQRLKLARELGRRTIRGQHQLYVLDEPTAGLSMHDVSQMLDLLQELVSQGHSVIIIEHDCQVLARCDWILELGPGSGEEGGKLIAQGTPRTVSGRKKSVIGPYLLPILSHGNNGKDKPASNKKKVKAKKSSVSCNSAS